MGHLCTAKLPKVQIPMGNRRSSSCWLRRSWREVAAQALPQGGVLWSNHSATASLLHPCGLPMGSWVRYPCAVLRRPVEQACDGVAATMLMAEQSLLRRRSNASLGRAHRNQNGGGARRTCVVATETKQHLTAESLCPPVASGPPSGSTCAAAATGVAGGWGAEVARDLGASSERAPGRDAVWVP